MFRPEKLSILVNYVTMYPSIQIIQAQKKKKNQVSYCIHAAFKVIVVYVDISNSSKTYILDLNLFVFGIPGMLLSITLAVWTVSSALVGW